MPHVNPDVHARGYQFTPLNRITAVFARTTQVRDVIAELAALGFSADATEVFVGERGAESFDLSADHHGPTARTIRNVEAIMVLEAGDAHRRADDALRHGGAVMAVLMHGHEAQKDAVVDVLKRHDGSLVRYWGRWSVEAFD